MASATLPKSRQALIKVLHRRLSKEKPERFPGEWSIRLEALTCAPDDTEKTRVWNALRDATKK